MDLMYYEQSYSECVRLGSLSVTGITFWKTPWLEIGSQTRAAGITEIFFSLLVRHTQLVSEDFLPKVIAWTEGFKF